MYNQLFQQSIQTIYTGFRNVLFPNNCIVCEKFIKSNENVICGDCSDEFEPTGLGNWIDDLRFRDGIDQVYSIWWANEVMSDIIHKIKYQNQARLGMELGNKMIDCLPPNLIENADLITVVPLNSTKHRERGYNQSEWISKGVTKDRNVSVDCKLLKRLRFTKTQTELSALERLQNVEDAFEARKNVNDKTIIIIDDVITTGATISACAAELKKGGAKMVLGLSLCTPKFGF